MKAIQISTATCDNGSGLEQIVLYALDDEGKIYAISPRDSGWREVPRLEPKNIYLKGSK